MVPTPPTSKVPRLVHPAWHSFVQRTRVRRRELKEMGYTKDKPDKVPISSLSSCQAEPAARRQEVGKDD